MSRTRELRLSGWVIECNLATDDMRFVDLIDGKGGALTFTTYILMRNLIGMQNGYYTILNDKFVLLLHRTLMGASKGQSIVKETIRYFGEIGLLDKASLDNNILTSVDIQENWLVAQKAKRQRLIGNLEHWLLVDTIPSGIDDNCNNNDDICDNYTHNCTQYKTSPNNKNISKERKPEIDSYNNLLKYSILHCW